MFEVKKFGEVCEFVRGPFGGSLKKNCFVEEGYAVYEQQHAIYNQFTNIRYFITEEKFNEMKRFKLKPNDLIMSCSGTMGKVAIVPNDIQEGIINQALLKLTPNDMLDIEYLKYWMNSPDFDNRIKENTVGAAIKNVASVKILKEIDIPIPPLEEQQQIVAILDKAFKAIDQAQANIKKNIENAQELFQSKLNDIFSQKGEGWEEKTLGKTCIVERGSSPRPIKKFLTESGDGVNWIKIGDVEENTKYVTQTKQKITQEGAEKSRFVQKGDLILSNSMSFGRAYIMQIDGCIHDGWFVLRLPEYMNPDYFWQLLSSPFVKNQINQLAAGAIVKNISGDLVKKVNLVIPPLEIQKIIANECDMINSICNKLTQSYENKSTNLEELKKSILQKAFAGELTNNQQTIIN